MSDHNLEKISNILVPSKQLSSPKKSLLSFTHSLKDLNDETIKTKLDLCLFGLKTINNKFKKGIFYSNPNSVQTHSNQQPTNPPKLLQNSILPRISHERQTKANKTRNEKLMGQVSYLNSKTEFVNASILKERLNHTCLSMSRQVNNSINYGKSLFPRMIKETLLQNASDSKSGSFENKIVADKLERKNIGEAKKPQIRPKIKKHLYEAACGKGLSKQNRYFPSNPSAIDREQVQKLGLYQSVNRYRRDFISREMNDLSPKIEKKELEFAKVCKQNELFLTRPKELEPTELDEFLKGQFVINEAKPKKYIELVKIQQLQKELPQPNNQLKSSQNPKQTLPVQDPIAQETNEQLSDPNKDITFFQIKNYQIIRNSSYLKFRVTNFQVWDQIQSLLAQIIAFVRQLKINSCRFKADNLLQHWSGKRLSTKDIEKILKISRKQIVSQQKTPIQSVLAILHAKRKMKAIIDAKTKRIGYIKWVSDRITGIRAIKKQTQYKINKAYEIQEQLFDGQYQWDTEIYISSFSENHFVRTTTQYMESFENMFTHMWKESSKHMILVIPTVNSEILQCYQEKLKIKRSVTLICPEVHELFPGNMSLAGCLLFSYEALNKIKQLIAGKKAIIIPGKYSSPKYELLISEFLRTPLMTSLKPRRDFQFQKEIFSTANLPVLPFISICQKTTMDDIIRNFARLLLSHREINQWVFKINGQFGGRGLATFCMKSSKVLKSIMSSCKDTIKLLEEYLKRNLKLKLKINFENSLFMLGDYLQRLAEKGGIIEEQKEQVESYEISFFIENKITCTLVSCFKCFAVSHSNKAFIYESTVNPKISSIVPKLKGILQKNEYLGYVSVSLGVAGEMVYGIEIKPYLTHLTSVEPFIKTIESKRQLKLNLSGRKHEKAEKEMISQTRKMDLAQKGKYPAFENQNHSPLNEYHSRLNEYHNSKINTEQSHLFSNINLSSTELQTLRPLPNDFTYLFIPNIIMTDVPIPKKAEFIESTIVDEFNRLKFDILGNNLVLYLSNGLSLSLLVVGKEVKRIKKTAIEAVRSLSEKTGTLKVYCGKNEARDVFQFGDIIKAVTQIKG